MLFSELGLCESLLKSLTLAGYTEATPIQASAIPPILAGKDVMGVAQTGTGKTAAFALPTLQRISEAKLKAGSNKSAIRCLVLVPTRELALQVNASFNKYGRSGLGGGQGIGVPMRYLNIFGGVNQFKQVEALRSGVDVLVATPGRLEDLYGQGHVDLSQVELLIMDEADQMLDMGFIIPMRRIAKQCPASRQTLMFSATMPREIKQLAGEMLRNPVEVSVAQTGTSAALVEQSAFLVDQKLKGFLLRHYLRDTNAWKALVFTRTKHGADRVAAGLVKAGINAMAIHGNRSQSQRVKALEKFKKGEVPVLVATDVAARGLHISEVSHVVNFDMPEVPETYVHRIGRTGRAGASGIAVSFVDREDRSKLRAVERLIRKDVALLPLPDLQVPAGLSTDDVSMSEGDDDGDDDRSQQRGSDRGDSRGHSRGGDRGNDRGYSRNNDRGNDRGQARGGFDRRDRNDRPDASQGHYKPYARPAAQGDRPAFAGGPRARFAPAPRPAAAGGHATGGGHASHSAKPHAATGHGKAHLATSKPHVAKAKPSHPSSAFAARESAPAARPAPVARPAHAAAKTGAHPLKSGHAPTKSAHAPARTGKPAHKTGAGTGGFGRPAGKFGGPASGARRNSFQRSGPRR